MIKILSSIFIALLFTVSAYAEQGIYYLSDFSRGKNEQISDLLTPDNQAVEANNVRVNEVLGGVAKREALLQDWDTGVDASVNGLHRFYKSDGTQRLIGATSTYLKARDDSNNTYTLKTGLTDGKKWQFITYKDIAIGTNGYDDPIKWDGAIVTTANTDGARTANNTVAELGAPFAELNTGSDLTASTWYQYKIAFYDGSTYSYSDARSNPILTGSTVRNVYLTDIPLGPTGTTYRYLFRTAGADQATVEANTTFYMVANITNNTGRFYADTTNDTAAATDADPKWSAVSAGDNITPPKGSIIELHKERAWISGNTTNPSDVYYSDEYNPDYFYLEDFIQIRPDDGDKITGLKNLLGILTTVKTNSISKIYTDGNDATDWSVSDPFSFVGSPAPYTIANTPLGMMYLGRLGIYNFNGQTSTLISDSVTPDIKDIAQYNIENAVAFYLNNEYRLAYTSTQTGATHNDRVLVYDLTRDAFVLDTEEISSFAGLNSGTDYGILYSGSSDTDGIVFAHSGGPLTLGKRYLSEMDLGTYVTADSVGTEADPTLEIAWTGTIDSWGDYASTIDELPGIIDRPGTSGTWTSPVYQIDATSLSKIYWNEDLNGFGDVTFNIRTGATSNLSAVAWSSDFSDPNGSDISGETANTYIQIKINLSTTNINYTPQIYLNNGYLFKIVYSKVGAAYETSVLSVHESGWKDLGVKAQEKMINRVKVYYEGTAGTLTLNIKNDEGTIDKNIPIDLSVDADDSSEDQYTGEGDTKIYTWYAPVNSETDPSIIGQLFKFTLTENGAVTWRIKRIEVKYEILPIE